MLQTTISSKQFEILKFPYMKDYDALICDGAIRSGKTVFCSISFIIWAMSKFNNCNFGICGKTIASCERNLIKPLMQIDYLRNEFTLKYNKQSSLLTITRGHKKNYFYLFGGRDESSYQLIQGITLAGILFDEVALMPKSFVEQGTARCSVEGSKYFFNCNPSDPNHYFKKEWIDDLESKNAHYLHFTMDDNPSLSEKIKDRYKSLYSGVFYQRYIEGKWVSAEGSIYRELTEHIDEYLVDEYPNNFMMIINGIDFGGTKSSDAFVTIGITKGFKQVYILESKQIVLDGNPITSDELNKQFIEYSKMIEDKYKMTTITYCDSAEPKLIESLRVACIKANSKTLIKNAKKSEIIERIKCTLTLIKQHRLKILRHNKAMIKAVNDAKWDDKKSTPEKDVRLDDFSYCVDLLDAFEYCFERYISNIMMA